MKKICLLSLSILLCYTTYAQTTNVEMADVLRSSGKIYVVVGTLALIFTGLIAYLFYLDKRLDKLEKEN